MLRRIAFALLGALIGGIGVAGAVQISPEQMKLAAQLPPAEQARLAASVGVTLPKQSARGAAEQAAPPTQVVLPQQEEPASALEQQLNARLSGRTQADGADGSASNGQSAPFGVNADDAALRAVLERSLSLNRRSIDQQLKQFGYSLFAGKPTSFAPASDIPVPPEYVLGPGDELQIQYYGRRNDSLSLIVDREGIIELPDVGAIAVAGMSFVQGKAMLSQKIRETLIGVTASISMGRLRSIRVFVLGDARNPGSYLVSGLSTVSNALFLAGGISKHGSLRHLLLKRHGKTIRDLDLYDLLLHGDSSDDVRLLPGDVIFVPPIGKVAAVAGEVVRPAIYELRHERTVDDLVRLAGGAAPAADLAHVQVEGIDAHGNRTLRDVNLQSRKQRMSHVRNGDLIAVYRVPAANSRTVTLLGQVKRPGEYGLSKGMRLSDLVRSRDDLLDDAFLDYALIQRTGSEDRSLKVLRVSLQRLFDRHDRSADIALQDEDKVFVLARSAIEPLDSVHITGQVVNPGTFPLTRGMHVVDLLLSAGGATEQAYMKSAEVTRYRVVDGETRESEHLLVNLAAALAGDQQANILLQPYDVLTIRTLSNWRTMEHVTLSGELRFPGEYPIVDGERLSTLIERAGGFSDKAYLEAAVFTRASIREDQQKKLAEMASLMEGEIARMESASANLSDLKQEAQRQAALASAKKMLAKMREAKATGRLVIELKDIRTLKGSSYDIALRDGDALYVPKRPDEVLVMGQVYNSTAMLYQKHLSVDDYIEHAGGMTRFADEDHIYVVHASGIVEPVRGGWHRTRLAPGDAIVVPEQLEQFNILSSALDWSKVLYQLGTALASMKVIGIL